jgi:flagellar basal body-associated protein FliL
VSENPVSDNPNTPVETSPEPVSPTSTVSTPISQSPKSHKGLIAFLIVIIVLLLAVGAGAGLYLATKKGDKAPSNQAASGQSGQNATTTPAVKSPLATVALDDPNLKLELTKLQTTGENMRVQLNVVCKATTCNFDPFTFGLSEGLKDTYAVDEVASQKYEIVKDANGVPLASKVDSNKMKKNQKISVYAIVTGPPKGATLSIYVPHAETFTGIVYK